MEKRSGIMIHTIYAYSHCIPIKTGHCFLIMFRMGNDTWKVVGVDTYLPQSLGISTELQFIRAFSNKKNFGPLPGFVLKRIWAVLQGIEWTPEELSLNAYGQQQAHSNSQE